MPHLNSRPFTEERMETILRQTLRDWECIIVDSLSDDGSREVLQSYGRTDPRIRLLDAPRDGIYRNLNRAIEASSGQYIYVATSDDTMRPECLEHMVNALERNPDCGLCHCCLEIIDENGEPVSSEYAWDNHLPQEYFGAWTGVPHVRRAPHDGLLHFGFFTVYTSLTQLLIRRSVFERLGLFRTDCSSHADFEWGMRASLHENVVHLPQKLATWRRHGQQATQSDRLLEARARGDFHRLAQCAIRSLAKSNPRLARALQRSPLHRFYLVDEFKARQNRRSAGQGTAFEMPRFVARHPLFSMYWLFCKLIRRRRVTGEFAQAVREQLARDYPDGLLHELD